MEGLICQYVLDFGCARKNVPRSSIDDLAERAIVNYHEKPEIITLAQAESYKAIRRRRAIPERQLYEIAVGQSSTNGTKGGGSYHVLQEMVAKTIMLERERSGGSIPTPFRADLIAHAAHAPRIIRQGKLFYLELVPVDNLPGRFYDTAAQWWCRNSVLWTVREVVGYIPLRINGQL